MFTMANTDGFTAADLDILNAVLVDLTAAGEDEKAASDRISNAWCEGMTADELRQAIRS